jgi:predicted transport protein
MAIFKINSGQAERIKVAEFKLEKNLQDLVEQNLQVFFNCRFVSSEFSTGIVHAGRIDTLSEDDNPVIIEYKKMASSELITQSLYYLNWLTDHRGDFELAVQRKLGKDVNIDWSDIRVICLAPDYKKYDLHAVKVIGANIELWQYKLYENSILSIEEIFRESESRQTDKLVNSTHVKNPVMVEAGRKAAITRQTAIHSIDQHFENVSQPVREIFELVREYILTLDDSVDESPKKKGIAYRTTQNFAFITIRKDGLKLYLKLDPNEYTPLPMQARDVSNTGRRIGDLEITILNEKDFESTKTFIAKALNNIGG